MSYNSGISWTDSTWNPIVGCTKISAGCGRCYAEKMAYRLACMGRSQYRGLTDFDGTWNGKTQLVESAFAKPLHWRKPRKIFVVSMGDLFHESVPFEWIAKVFYTMAVCYWHQFMVLTKRSGRQREFFEWVEKRKRGLWWQEFGVLAAHPLGDGADEIHRAVRKHYWPTIPDPVEKLGDAGLFIKWPLPNVHGGVTIENRKNVWRIEDLIRTPFAKRFVSFEPLLGRIQETPSALQAIDYAFIGCESGAKARLCKQSDITYTMRQCRTKDVKIHVKQIPLNGKCNKNIDEWPEEFQVRDI